MVTVSYLDIVKQKQDTFYAEANLLKQMLQTESS
jgi:hypothetical protein